MIKTLKAFITLEKEKGVQEIKKDLLKTLPLVYGIYGIINFKISYVLK